jgi:hypothetical protein
MRDQRGMSLSPFIAVVVPALLVMIGLVVDGGAQAAASRRAEWVAAAAARAATDDTAAARLAGQTPDNAHAIAVARRIIEVEPGFSGEVSVAANRVVVHITTTTPTVLLSLIGIQQLTASGSAEAELIADR